MTLRPLPGDPEALGRHAARYTRIAETIAELSGRLEAFAAEVGSASGKAVVELSDRAGRAAEKVDRAQPRYETTARALTSYSVQLRDAQSSADRAISAAATAEASLPYFRRRRAELIWLDHRPVLTPEDLQELQERRDERRLVDARLEELEGDLAAAETGYDRAVAYRDAAARAVIDAIRPALEQMNDTLGYHVDAWVESLPGFIQVVAQWIGDVFVGIVEALGDLVEALVAAITYVVTYVVVFAEILANYPPEIWLAMLIAPGLGVPLVLALTAYLAARLAKEPLRPTPELLGLGPVAGASSGDSHYADTMVDNKRLDDDGGVDSTRIQVVEVLDENGERQGWRVILPSTQDWQEISGMFGGTGPEGDQGALNDLDSNLALMLTPGQQAAYERAVVRAMLEAGIGPDDPVMLCGWSQGGIMAATLASDPDLPFTVQAVFAAGAPIDAMPIPDAVSVISIQHPGDVVHLLDGPVSAPGRQGENWVTIPAPVPIDPGTGQPYEQPHNADAYATSAAAHVDASADPRVQRIAASQERFFSGNEVVSVYVAAEEPVPL